MKGRIKSFTQRPFVRSVAVLATGTAAAQFITMAFSPVITRLYGAEAFGTLGVFTTLLGFLGPLAALSFPIAIILPKKNGKAYALIKLSLVVSFIFTFILSVIIVIFKDTLIDILNLQNIGNLIYLLPGAVFFTVILQILQQWFIRLREFKLMSKTAVYQALILNILKSGIGMLQPTATVLISISAVSPLIYGGMLMKGMKNKFGFLKSSYMNRYSKVAVAREYKDFAYFRSPQILLNRISSGLPIILLASFFGPATAGFYTLSRSVLSMPVQLIGKSVADVFYPRITEASANNENMAEMILKATRALAGVGAIPFGIIIVFGPWLFSIIFGSEWVVAGEYARWISFWLFFALINKPSVAAIPVLNLQGQFLVYELVNVFLKTVAIGIGFLAFGSDVYAIILFSVVGVITNIFLISFVLKFAHKRSE